MQNTVVIFAGEYDLTCKARLREQLQSLERESSLILDFSDVSYLDSSAITELVSLHRARAEHGFDAETIILRHPTVRRVFQVLQLGSIFRLVDSLDEAMSIPGEAVCLYAFTTDESLAAS